MSNLDEPTVGEIIVPHFLFAEPGWWIRRIVDRDKTVVVRAADIIDPRIRRTHLMERIIRAARKLRVVSINFADFENAGRSSTVSLFLSQSTFILAGETTAPG